MRIGLVAPVWCSVPPVGYGGTEQVLDALARGLAELGHEVVLAATGDSTCPVPRRWLLPRPAESIGTLLPELRHVLFAYDELEGCDVVHDHTLAGLLVGAARSRRTPVVTTSHGPLDGELAALYRQLEPRVPVIGISRVQAVAAPDLVRAVVHHGLVLSDVEVGAGDGGHLAFLGRMSAGKGAHRAAVVARSLGVPLLMAAKMREPAEREYFEQRVRPLLGEGVEFVGEVSGEDKQRLLRGARALLMPIRWPEPFGMVMIEALACGTPVLAFPEGAAPEVVEHGRTGFLCRDEGEMAAAVGRLDELSRADCRAAAEQRFSACRMARDHVAVYERLSQERRVRRARPAYQVHATWQATDVDAARPVHLDVEAGAAEGDALHPQ